jgi:hypothetical protein
MMVMTARVDFKKILLMLTAVAVILLAILALLGGGNGDTAQTAAPSMSANDSRVQFLKDFGWDVTPSPKESGQVKIPKERSPVFDRYNTMQLGQGYDLSSYAEKNVMRYVYQINNYPGATEPVYATVLVYKNQIIGGDVTDTAAKGHIRGFKMPESTVPIESTALPTQ